jgi:hypothetical protein
VKYPASVLGPNFATAKRLVDGRFIWSGEIRKSGHSRLVNAVIKLLTLLLLLLAGLSLAQADSMIITIQRQQRHGPLAPPPPLPENTLMAASGTSADIQSAVNSAHSGDTIVIPAGTFSFSGQVFLTDAVSIRGAGRDQTRLVKTSKLGEWKPMITVNCSTGRPFHFSGITLQGNGYDLGWPVVDMGLFLQGRCLDFLIHDSRFTRFARSAIEFNGDQGAVHGSPRGVIYTNEFIDNWISWLGYSVAVLGSASAWNEPLTLGTGEAVFIEDNYFTGGRDCIDSNNGARYVARHNTFVNNRENSAPLYTHQKSSWPRGTRSFEIYDNHVLNPAEQRYAAILLGGGTGVIFNNDLNDVSWPIILFNAGPAWDPITDTYLWNNAFNGSPVTSVGAGAGPYGPYTEGTDYFFQQKPGYQPYPYPHPGRE